MKERSDPVENAGSDPDAVARCTGGSAHDPHGGTEVMPRSQPDPDPITELATIDTTSQNNDPNRPTLAHQPGAKPGFGPGEFKAAEFEGDPNLGIDPREAASITGNGR